MLLKLISSADIQPSRPIIHFIETSASTTGVQAGWFIHADTL